jgi:REP element-mobilizing transposase RayT
LNKKPQASAKSAWTCGLLPMSRLRRIDLAILGETLNSVRTRVKVVLCGYCLMPDHWHAVLFPDESASISDILLRIKTSSSIQIQKARRQKQLLWQPRFFDRILHTRGEFDKSLDYMHENPVTQGLVGNSLDWKWSSTRWLVDRIGPIRMDDVKLPLNPWDRI